MATHSNTLAWRIPWTEEPGGLQSIGSHRVGYDWSNQGTLILLAPHSSHIISCFQNFEFSPAWKALSLYLPRIRFWRHLLCRRGLTLSRFPSEPGLLPLAQLCPTALPRSHHFPVKFTCLSPSPECKSSFLDFKFLKVGQWVLVSLTFVSLATT